MFPNSKTPVQTTTLRGSNNKSSSNSNTAPDPIKDAYKLKSQIDAVQKSQQSFKTSEIIQIQTKLLTKAWKWISKYGIGSLNQYTKMKKQIQNYEILMTTIAGMKNDIQHNFQALHRINKQHSISLNNIQSNIYINNNHLRQFKSNINKQFKQTHNDKQQIVSLLTQNNQALQLNIELQNENTETDNNQNDIDSNNDVEVQMDEIELPLNLKQINNIHASNNHNDSLDDNQMMLSSAQLSPQLSPKTSDNVIDSEHKNNDDNKQFEEEDSDVDDKIIPKPATNIIESDVDPSYSKLSNISNANIDVKQTSTRLLDNVDTMSVQSIDVSAYKAQDVLVEKQGTFSQVLLSDRDRSESVIKLNDKSMMKAGKLQKSHSDVNYNVGVNKDEQKGLDDFSVSAKENKIMDAIMGNLTKLDALSHDFNNFIVSDSEKYKLETKQIIKSKLKPLHEILEQRELGLLSELRYLHKEKMIKMKQKQHILQQNKNYLKMKLSQCQKILQQYQMKWEEQYKLLQNQFDKNGNIISGNNNENNSNNSAKFDFNNLFKDNQFQRKAQNLRITLIKERKNQLNVISNEINQDIEFKLLQREIDDIKQMYMFTVHSANLHSLKQQLQSLGEFIDFAAQNAKNGKLSKTFNGKNKILFKKNVGTAIGNSASSSLPMNSGDVNIDENKGKFSDMINKKFNEFIGRKQSSITSSMTEFNSGMNLDHVNAVDAQSVSSGNRSDNDDDTNINKSNSNLNVVDGLVNDNNQRNRPSVSISTSAPPSEVMTDLP